VLVFRPTIKGTKTEFAVFVAQLLVAFLFTLIGWVVTLTALSRNAEEVSVAESPKTVPEAPAAEAPA